MNNENYLDPRTVRFRKEYQDKHFFTKDGKEEFIITDARTYGDVDILFPGSGIVKNTKVGNIKNGLPNPFVGVGTHGKPGPVAFDTPQCQYNGCIYKTNYDGYIQILEYICYEKVHYKFLDETGYEGYTTMQNIKKGQVRNPFKRNAYGGYLGFGDYNGNEYKFVHRIWYNMLTRATGQRYKYSLQSDSYMNVKSYENLLLDPEWFCFNDFAAWYMNIFSKLNTKEYIYNVDKDLLYPYYSIYTNGRKCYSKYTCVILPKQINTEIAIYGANSETTQDKLKKILEDICISCVVSGALDIDLYYVIRRFYLKDPAYADYISERCKYMDQITKFANFNQYEYESFSSIAPSNI